MQFHQYRLSIRRDFNPVLQTGKLTQQFVVDAYVKMESNRLHYIRKNQPKLKAEAYAILRDYIAGARETTGKPVILPSTFEGKERCWLQRYQYSVAVVRHLGKPCLFLTMTCNPNWKEITENLKPGERPHVRPDLIARVFEMKRKKLIEIVTKTDFFGRDIAGFMWTKEYQKRGVSFTIPRLM